ncbi:MAG: cytochrome ubiquinol oxidase subunit I [Candidatus Omnitrophota bacterium]|jgi:cytochrome d ubiquinol oxidase subunit I
MDPALLARIQFAVTIGFHYIYPPVTIGLGLLMAVMEGLYLKTRNPLYSRMTRFWTGIFALTFALGTATGIVMEFEFGTNWATYSRFVGDVFGSPLAIEGIFAFFLESSFLGILVFGWDRVGPKMHFFSTVMVALGSALSAVWIVVANSWMQTPAGYFILTEGAKTRAQITNFWEMVLNPSAVERVSHVLMGCYAAGAFLVLSVGAYYLLRKQHEAFSKSCMKIALVLAALSSLGQLATGHASAVGVSKHQPVKLAAFEGHFEAHAPGTLYLFGWVDPAAGTVRYGAGVPGGLSLLVSGDFTKKLPGLAAFPKTEWPPVNIVFQTYHLMIMIGMALIGLSLFGLFAWWRGFLFSQRWLLGLFAVSFLGPQIANQVGWMTAEIGRQPWIVYGLLKTADGISRTVSAREIAASLVMFLSIYLVLFGLYVFLLIEKIKHGPELKP